MLNFIKNGIYKVRNKEGMTAIEMVIGVFIFIIMLSFMMDILILFWKFSVVSQTTTQVARMTGIQGGALANKPTDWPDNDGYQDINSLNQLIQRKFDTANIDRWVVEIGDGKIGTEGIRASSRIDYKEEFTVATTIEYRWDFMSNFIPGMNLRQDITAKRPVMSEWKYNYGNWNGE